MQPQLSYYFFQSHYGRESRLSESTSAYGAATHEFCSFFCSYGACPLFICFWLSVNFLSSPGNGYSEGRRPMPNVGVHWYISNPTSSELVVFYGSVRIVFFFTHKDDIAGQRLLH